MRALAAFMVFTWHFTHAGNGFPVPFDDPQAALIPLLDEGHTGVALFMTLSGYLFAKILDGRQVNYLTFTWNRTLRLVPALAIVLLVAGGISTYNGGDPYAYAKQVASGILLPVLPNGGWSITVEFHFYLLLPLLLLLARTSRVTLPLLLIGIVVLRTLLYMDRGEIQSLSYWTIVGRIDQFMLGMLAFQLRRFIAKRHLVFALAASAFLAFYMYFDMAGGFYQLPAYPSPSALWIILPTIEGLFYATLIAYYDNSFAVRENVVTGFLAKIGSWSYSIYLLHFFFVFKMAEFVHSNIMDISNFYAAVLWSAICFIAILPIAYLSFRFIETPFLSLRKKYIKGSTHQLVDHSRVATNFSRENS